MAILWDPIYETGDLKIDQQHQKLFDAVNEIEVIVSKDVIEKAHTDRLLNFLTSYTRSHFTYEEICMMQHQCPSAGCNKKAHGKFLDFVNEFVMNYQEHGPNKRSLEKLQRTAESWLKEHICKIDVQLKPCIERAA